MAASSPTGTDWQDVTMPLETLLRLALRWTLYLAVLLFVPYVWGWGWPRLALGGWPSAALTVLAYVAGFVVVYGVSAVVHEGLHALTMVALGVPWRSIRFGVRWSEGVAYVHSPVPMTVRAYRVVLAVPGVVQGMGPALAGLLTGNGWLLLYGYVMLASSVGDAVMLRLLAPFDGHRLVRDHPTDIGCQVQVGAGVGEGKG